MNRSLAAFKTLTAILILLACAACATGPKVRTQIERHNSMPADFAGKTFAVILPETKNALEARQLAAHVTQRLQGVGLTPAPRGVPADYDVYLNYGIDDGHSYSWQAPVYTTIPGRTVYHSGSIAAPGGYTTYSYSGTSYVPSTSVFLGYETRTTTTYEAHMSVGIVDPIQSTLDQPFVIFEADGHSRGASPIYLDHAPCILQAAFDGFPGQDSEVYEKEQPVSACRQ